VESSKGDGRQELFIELYHSFAAAFDLYLMPDQKVLFFIPCAWRGHASSAQLIKDLHDPHSHPVTFPHI